MNAPQRIERVEAWSLAAPLSAPIVWATGAATTRTTTLVAATLDSGHTGWGETPDAVPMTALARVTAALFRETVTEHTDVATIAASSALDIALWDARGKACNAPVWKLFSPIGHGPVRAYASGLYYDATTPAGIEAEVKRHLRDGFRAAKMKIGRDPKLDFERVRAARRALGPTASLMVDANEAYSHDRALEVATELATLGVTWLEEPIPGRGDGYSALAGPPAVPLAAGENCYGVDAFEPLLRTDTVAFVQPNVGRVGGMSDAFALARAAARARKRIAFHSWGTNVLCAAAVHVAFAASSFASAWVEFDRTTNPLRDATEAEHGLGEGLLLRPRAPGLGVRVHRLALDCMTHTYCSFEP